MERLMLFYWLCTNGFGSWRIMSLKWNCMDDRNVWEEINVEEGSVVCREGFIKYNLTDVYGMLTTSSISVASSNIKLRLSLLSLDCRQFFFPGSVSLVVIWKYFPCLKEKYTLPLCCCVVVSQEHLVYGTDHVNDIFKKKTHCTV